MRVAVLAPNYYPAHSGNAVTVRRIEHHLRLLGCEVLVLPVDQLSGDKLVADVRAFSPQVLHAFHGYQGGRIAHALCESLGIPYVVTVTGTDVYQALCDQRAHDTHGALRGAARIVAFHASIKKRLAMHLPSLEERTVVIPQGVDLPVESGLPEKTAGEGVTFLLPAGLRPVKNVMFPLQPLSTLHTAHPELRLLLVGPVLDPDYAAEVMEALEQFPFARYVGRFEHEAMCGLYREADVVLNTSLSEGGMANTLLEAMAHGKAVLVSDIEGNRSLVKEGVTGLLYRDVTEFSFKAELLLSDPHLRERLGKNGKDLVREKHSPQKEAAAYLQLYDDVLAAFPPSSLAGRGLGGGGSCHEDPN